MLYAVRNLLFIIAKYVVEKNLDYAILVIREIKAIEKSLEVWNMLDQMSDYTDMFYEASDTIKSFFSKVKEILPELAGFVNKWLLDS